MTEDIVLKKLTTDNEYFSNTFSNLEAKDFSKDNRTIFSTLSKLYHDYNKAPNLDEIKLIFESKGLNESTRDKLVQRVQEIKETSADINKDILLDSTESWLKLNRFRRDVLLPGMELLDGDDSLSIEEIQKTSEEITKLSFKKSLGMDYIKDALSSFTQYQQIDEDGIKMNISLVDTATRGGFKPGTLTTFAGVSNVSKTTFLVNVATNAMLQNKKVAYFSFEETELDIRERFDGCLLKKDTSTFKDLGVSLNSSFRQLLKNGIGNAKIKEYPPRGATLISVENQLNEWEQKEGFIPDIILLDSVTIIKPVVVTSNSYDSGKNIAESMKGLSVRLKTPVVTCVQFGRQAYSSSNPGMEDVAESLAVMQTSSTAISIIDDEKRPNIRVISIIKSRKLDKNSVKACVVNIDVTQQRIWDTEEHQRSYIKQEQKDEINFAKTALETASKAEENGGTSNVLSEFMN